MNAQVLGQHWALRLDADRIAWLALDKQGAGANSLSRDVMEQLDQELARLTQSPPRALIVHSNKTQGFIAGADIKEFLGIKTAAAAVPLIKAGQAVLTRLERLPFPTVAAINGYALGGGLELALACKYRIAAESHKPTLGFPEVMLGLHPGFGGTVRAVRLAGPIAAMELMLTGRSLRPNQARALGLIDQVVPAPELLERARTVALNPPPVRGVNLKHSIMNLAPVRKVLANKMRAQTARRVRPEHYPAPFALIDLWERGGGKGEASMEAEAQSMAQLICTPTSRNLVRVFFLQERMKALGKEGSSVQRVHVVGAGVMGADIAAWCALRGLSVTLQDRGQEFIDKGLLRARELFARRSRDPQQRAAVEERLVGDLEGHGIATADVVIEAIFENATAKQELFARTEPLMRADAVLATNTSSIMLEVLQRTLKRPERLLGLHFFNPVPKMPLVEVIRSDSTDTQRLQRALAFVRQIDKLPLPCHSAPGFVVNRILMPYLTQALRAVEEGIPLAAIDAAAEDFGMPMGPIELADVVGLDVIASVGNVLNAQAMVAPPKALTLLLDQKKLGSKTGEGFYRWENGKAMKPPLERETIPPDLQDRLILALVNEAVAVLREGIVDDADLIDAGAIFGAGFAPFRGGPIHYARERGVTEVVERLKQLAAKYGPALDPDAGWQLLH
ncbi:MAG TPA: 3-hydroxyacyl-CoA dehydrogenase NAD-binding domain-containing protein [Steroidobacteraceae bacterium]|nr:3-hydroxyacyl-CoA dehydrogenase NAD-binding domain-containing protein [Steroidobacteraceae bacterium]